MYTDIIITIVIFDKLCVLDVKDDCHNAYKEIWSICKIHK